MKKIIIFLICFSISFLLGCQNDKGIEEEKVSNLKTLYWNIGAYPKTLDPGLNTGAYEGHVINNIYEGLMREHNGELKPAMAEYYEVSDDGKYYKFVLKDNAKWSDGESVTAYDFEYAWNRVLNPETQADYSGLFENANIESFKAVDEKTFEVRLSVKTPWFLNLTSFYSFFPVREDVVNQKKNGLWSMDPSLAVTNGPFKLKEYNMGKSLVLTKNKYYWDIEKVKLDKIVGEIIIDSEEAMKKFNDGKLHINANIPVESMDKLIAEEDVLKVFPTLGTYYYSFNMSVEPLDDLKVRKALSLAIDRNAIVESVTKSGEIPAKTILPEVMSYKNKSYNELFVDEDYMVNSNVSRARELLKEAGYPSGKNFPVLELVYNKSDLNYKVANVIKDMWKVNLGIDIQLRSYKWDIYQEVIDNKEFDIVRAGWVADYNDPLTFLGLFESSSTLNYGDWKSKEYDEFIQKASDIIGNDRLKYFSKANNILSKDYAVIPIYYYTNPQIISKNLENWEFTTRNDWYFGYSNIEK